MALDLPPLPHDLGAAARRIFGARTIPPQANPALVWSRYPRLWQSDQLPKNEQRQGFLEAFVRDFEQPALKQGLGRALRAQHARLAAGDGVEARAFEAVEPIALGLGDPHPTENGLAFAPLLGVPWLPGSSLAGLARRTATLLGAPREQVERLLGSAAPEHSGIGGEATRPGQVAFLGGWPTVDPWPGLCIELINPHHPAYLQDQSNSPDRRSRLAWYTDEPRPVALLAVAPGTRYTVYLQALPRGTQAPDLAPVWTWLAVGLNMLGVGGKTASGFGRLRMPDRPVPKPTPPQAPAPLTAGDLHDMVDAAIQAHLGGSDQRALLLVGLPAGFSATLPTAGSPRDQLLSDLNRLLQVPELDGLDRPPLAVWLDNAYRLARGSRLPQAAAFERWRARVPEATPPPPPPPKGPSLAVILEAPIGGRRTHVNVAEVQAAVSEPCGEPFRVFSRGQQLPKMETRWNNLDFRIQKAAGQIADALQKTGARRLAIAGLAPMPMLISLGWHLGDTLPGEALNKLHDHPWGWLPEEASDQALTLHPPTQATGAAALLINLSGRNDPADLPERPEGWRVWTLTVPSPNYDVIRSRAQRSQFLTLARQALAQISQSKASEVHVFPAMPAALAVELGRLYLPKAWPPLKIWDRGARRWTGPYPIG